MPEKGNDNHGAGPVPILTPNGATVEFDDTLADRQAKAAALGLRWRPAKLLEAVKHGVALVDRDARAFVGHA